MDSVERIVTQRRLQVQAAVALPAQEAACALPDGGAWAAGQHRGHVRPALCGSCGRHRAGVCIVARAALLAQVPALQHSCLRAFWSRSAAMAAPLGSRRMRVGRHTVKRARGRRRVARLGARAATSFSSEDAWERCLYRSELAPHAPMGHLIYQPQRGTPGKCHCRHTPLWGACAERTLSAQACAAHSRLGV